MFLHLTFISHFLSISSHVSYHFAYGIVSFVVKGRSDVNEVFILEIFILEPESIEFLKIIKLVLDFLELAIWDTKVHSKAYSIPIQLQIFFLRKAFS